jgi:hypothetical protein
MKKEIALLLIVLAFASGFLVGHRRLRPHNYALATQPGGPIILFDTETGKVCSPMINLLKQRDEAEWLRSLPNKTTAEATDEFLKQPDKYANQMFPPCPE